MNLGILTANWFTCGTDFKEISICAKGLGHFKFKVDVIDHSQYIILVAPLGKLLPIDDSNLLNSIMPKVVEYQFVESESKYQSYTIPKGEKRNNVTFYFSESSYINIANCKHIDSP
jgi:hypothetical protein